MTSSSHWLLDAGGWHTETLGRRPTKGCQKKIVRKITDRHGDYLISLKGNQERMHDEIRELFETSFRNGRSHFVSYTETTSGHGRVEKRTCWQTDYLDWFQDKQNGPGSTASA